MVKRLFLYITMWAAAAAHADVPIEQTRRLIEQGEILPLQEVIAVLQRQRPGHAIEVELEHEGDGYRYEIEWLDPDGRVWELKLDARSGELLQQSRDH